MPSQEQIKACDNKDCGRWQDERGEWRCRALSVEGACQAANYAREEIVRGILRPSYDELRAALSDAIDEMEANTHSTMVEHDRLRAILKAAGGGQS